MSCSKVLLQASHKNDNLTYLSIFEALIDASLMLSVCGVKIILNAVVRAAWELLCDVRPLIAQQLVQAEYLMLLLSVDRILLDVGVQVIVPPIKNSGDPSKVQWDTYLSRHCLPVRPLILNYSFSFYATKVHRLVP